MTRAGLARALPIVLAVLLVAAGIALIASRAFRPGNEARADPCAERLAVIAPDGRTVDVVARRCQRRPGHRPALLVVARDPRSARAWRDGLIDWSNGGRTVWLLVLEGEEHPGPVIEAVLAELTAEDGVDPGRVALLLDRGLAGEAAIEAPVAGAAALVLFGARRDEDGAEIEARASGPAVLEVTVPAGRAAPDVDRWLSRRLAVEPRESRDGTPSP